MKKSMSYYFLLPITITFFLFLLLGINRNVFAKVESKVLKNVTLDEAPKDITVSSDGATAYILCAKNILIYSTQENKVIDTIPLTGEFSQIALSPDGGKLFLTGAKKKQLSIIQILQTYDIEVGRSPIIGKADAPVSVFAFLDYQWPYCARIYPVLEQLLEKYPKDVNLVIKHFPLRMHKFAEKASIAALAAAKQNKYQEITKILLKNYKKLNDKTITEYAEETGLDMEKFNKAYNDPSIKKIVGQDMKLGKKVKVRGVPAIFINGRTVKKRSLNDLSKMVESELKKTKWA